MAEGQGLSQVFPNGRMDAVVILPPPLTGQTLVSAAMCAQLAVRPEFHLHAIRNSTGLKGPVWTLAKHARILWALIRAGLARPGRGAVYVVPDAGGGLWFNIVQAVVMRLLFAEIWLHHHVFSYVGRRDRRMALILKLLGGKARHIALGQTMAHQLRTRYGAEAITVLGNAAFAKDVPPPQPRAALGTIGFLGNITRDKGIGLFMETIGWAQQSAPELRCVIAGPIRDETLRAEILAFCAQSPETRHWLGPVHGDDKAAFFAGCDLLLFPSLYANEALPVTIYEALAAGLPVLATRRGCVPDQLPEAWQYGEDDFAQQAPGAIINWCEDPVGFQAASHRAIALYEAHLTQDRAVLAALLRQRVS